jgi:HAD superfamily hydrolase (TIGR01509 family)
MQLSSIIFDMDGVLIDSEPVHKLAKKRAFERFGMSLPEDVYEKYRGRPDDTMMIEVVRSIGDKNLEPEELIHIKHEEFEAIEHMVVPVRGAKEFVLWARTRYRIALATSATPRNRRAALSLLGLENSFDVIVDSSGFSKPKPDPEVFERAILGLGTSAEECLVIEDSLNGILAAKAAGCIAAAIPTSFTKQELARSGADFVVDNFEQLRGLIETLEGGCRYSS